MDFEKKLKNLETIVSKMESGELSLDDSLKNFENGVSIARECHEQLAKAEKKVQELVSVDAKGKATTKDFN